MKILLICIFLFCSVCYAQNDSPPPRKIENNSLTFFDPSKIKYSLGVGLVVSKESNYINYTAEAFKTFTDNIALGVGLEIYKHRNESNQYSPSLNFYAAYNLYSRKSQFVEFYFGPGIETFFTGVQILALLRADFNISKSFAVGISLKQPIFYNKQESSLTYHIFKLNISYNFF